MSNRFMLSPSALQTLDAVTVTDVVVARKRASVIMENLSILDDVWTKEVYLFREFFVNNCSEFYQHLIRDLFLSEFDQTAHDDLNWLYGAISPICLSGLFIVQLCVLLTVGVDVASKSSYYFWCVFLFGYLSHTLLLLPSRVLLQFFAIDLITHRRLKRLRQALFTRAHRILKRKNAFFMLGYTFLQHMNPACRAARACPSLSVSKLLIATNDVDFCFVMPCHKFYEFWYWGDTPERMIEVASFFLLRSIFRNVPVFLQRLLMDFVFVVGVGVSLYVTAKETSDLFVILLLVLSGSIGIYVGVFFFFIVSSTGTRDYVLSVMKELYHKFSNAFSSVIRIPRKRATVYVEGDNDLMEYTSPTDSSHITDDIKLKSSEAVSPVNECLLVTTEVSCDDGVIHNDGFNNSESVLDDKILMGDVHTHVEKGIVMNKIVLPALNATLTQDDRNRKAFKHSTRRKLRDREIYSERNERKFNHRGKIRQGRDSSEDKEKRKYRESGRVRDRDRVRGSEKSRVQNFDNDYDRRDRDNRGRDRSTKRAKSSSRSSRANSSRSGHRSNRFFPDTADTSRLNYDTRISRRDDQHDIELECRQIDDRIQMKPTKFLDDELDPRCTHKMKPLLQTIHVGAAQYLGRKHELHSKMLSSMESTSVQSYDSRSTVPEVSSQSIEHSSMDSNANVTNVLSSTNRKIIQYDSVASPIQPLSKSNSHSRNRFLRMRKRENTRYTTSEKSTGDSKRVLNNDEFVDTDYKNLNESSFGDHEEEGTQFSDHSYSQTTMRRKDKAVRKPKSSISADAIPLTLDSYKMTERLPNSGHFAQIAKSVRGRTDYVSTFDDEESLQLSWKSFDGSVLYIDENDSSG